jgi:hypothetical protein
VSPTFQPVTPEILTDRMHAMTSMTIARTPGPAGCLVAGISLAAFLMSGCGSTALVTGGDTAVTPSAGSSAPRTTATTSPSPTVPPTVSIVIVPGNFGSQSVRMSSIKLVDGSFTIALVGPKHATFRLQFANGLNRCDSKEGTLDASAATGLPADSVQHYNVSCLETRDGKRTDYNNLRLLTKVMDLPGSTSPSSSGVIYEAVNNLIPIDRAGR